MLSKEEEEAIIQERIFHSIDELIRQLKLLQQNTTDQNDRVTLELAKEIAKRMKDI